MRALLCGLGGAILGAAFDMAFVHPQPVYGIVDAAFVLGPGFLGLLLGVSPDA